MLSIIVFTPIIGALIMAPIHLSNRTIKIFTLIISLVTFWISLFIYVKFDSGIIGYQIIANQSLNIFNNSETFNSIFAVDGISLPFILLTTFLTPLVILASWKNVKKSIKAFIATQLVIEGLLIGVWLVTDLFSFYIAFEAVLIPLFITVGIWGSGGSGDTLNAGSLRSAFLLFIFTLSGSLFILISIILIYVNTGVGSLAYIDLLSISIDNQSWIWVGIFVAFAIKTPMVPFHIWLPRAHADAPLAASMVLAGTVLKMATYGYLRLCIQIIPVITSYFIPIIQIIAVISLIYASLATIRQSDIKALIAYSSIGHMAVVILGIFSNNILGLMGGIILSLGHGVVSPVLFVLTGGVLYDRYHTRNIFYYRGITNYIPIFSVIFFIAVCCNIGVPLTINWIGEFIALIGIFPHSIFVLFWASTGIVLSAIYSIWVFVRINFGSFSPYLAYTSDINRREFVGVIIGISVALILGTYSLPLTTLINITLSSLIW